MICSFTVYTMFYFIISFFFLVILNIFIFFLKPTMLSFLHHLQFLHSLAQCPSFPHRKHFSFFSIINTSFLLSFSSFFEYLSLCDVILLNSFLTSLYVISSLHAPISTVFSTSEIFAFIISKYPNVSSSNFIPASLQSLRPCSYLMR